MGSSSTKEAPSVPKGGSVRQSQAARASQAAKKVSVIEENRKCTDICWLVLWVVAWIVYISVTLSGVQDGNLRKLFRPRDFSGAYCGIERQWNSGPNLAGKEKLTYMMNVSAVADQVAKQLLCSSATSSFLLGASSPLTLAQKDRYTCGCCLTPCEACDGGLELGRGGNIRSASDLQTAVAGRTRELQGTSASLSDFFNPAGYNGDFATKMWEEATKYFFQVCLPDCNTDFDKLGNDSRTYVYQPSVDSTLREIWIILQSTTNPAVGPIVSALNDRFTFRALPASECAYDPVYCVPFPGVKFIDFAADRCSFQMSPAVTEIVGGTAAQTFEALGSNSFANSTAATLGGWMGDLAKAWDAFSIVATLTFMVALVFLVLLRFLIGPCVWLSILLVTVLLFVGGGISWVRSFQCEGSGLLDSGRQALVAVTVAGGTAVANAASGVTPRSEALTGDGSDYVGVQQITRMGYRCKNWDLADSRYWPVLRASANLEMNYCRNPYNASSPNRAKTIWCFTRDEDKTWELCVPVGVIRPECQNGFTVRSQTARDMLKVGGYLLWILGGIWLIIVLCFISRIKLAIKLSQVAAYFVSHHSAVALVPVVQGVVAIIWMVAWFSSACFLISQVPDNYTPMGAYATYAEAFGTEDTPGKCTDKWPTGLVYRDEACPESDPRCWRCAPPRFIFDTRFFISFFVYLWNNAFILALGQCVISGAVGIWFFTPNAHKGSRMVLSRSLINTFRYHTGSLAFGAFILAVVQLIRYSLLYMEKQAAAQKNKVMVIVLKILQYIVWCLEKFIRFLTKNAYIQVALAGTSFCTSAKKAWDIIKANFVRFGVVATLGRVVHLIGLFFIVALSTVSGYFIFKCMHPEASPVVPILAFGITSYVVAKAYLNVFAMAVDTCLQCFIMAEKFEAGQDMSFVPAPLKNVLQPKAAEAAEPTGVVPSGPKKVWPGGGEDGGEDDGQ